MIPANSKEDTAPTNDPPSHSAENSGHVTGRGVVPFAVTVAIAVSLTVAGGAGIARTLSPAAGVGSPNTGAGAVAPDTTAPQRTLFLSVDGLSWEAFQEARNRGLFGKFIAAGRLVAPYPSMSHPSWMDIMGTNRLFGMRGNIRTVEARWFDLDGMYVHDDPREVIRRQAGDFNYMRAFDTYLDPLIEPLMYFPGKRLFDRELEEIERDISHGFNGQLYAAYISGSDALAHTHKDSLYSYLTRLDATLARIVDSVQTVDSSTRVWMISDHGNSGGFEEGQTEDYLKPVSLSAAAKRAGLGIADSGTVTDSGSVAVVTIALASMINTYFPDLSRRRAFAHEALREEGVTLVTWLEAESDARVNRHIVLLSNNGEAHLFWKADSIEYRVITGNPLGIPDYYVSTASRSLFIHDTVARRITERGEWPDAPYRLITSAEKLVENAPDLIVNLADGYCADGNFGRVVRMVRTHGALSRRATLGVIAGTSGSLPEYVRTDEALAVMNLTPAMFFGDQIRTYLTPAGVALKAAAKSPFVATGKRANSVDAAFLKRAAPIVQSMGYFAWKEIGELASTLSRIADQPRNIDTRALRQTDVLAALTQGADPILELGDSLQSADMDGALESIAAFAESRRDLRPVADLLTTLRSKTGGTPGAPIDELVAARQLTMAAWTLPAFLNTVLREPDSDSIADTRDLAFATRWITRDRNDVRLRPERLQWGTPLAQKLLHEVFTERLLLHNSAPGAAPLLYTADPGDITVVLLPGIYTELFDDEIWQRGLRSVRDNLGVRTIALSLDGRCSSEINAVQLLSDLKADTRRRLERGYKQPRYLLLGYSKGGVDATHALITDSTFAHEQVAALVTIATPHGGSPVPERADLPEIITQRSSRRPLHGACTQSPASQSISPQAQSSFWSAHGTQLAERTRLFSISFVTDNANAHPWMQLTRKIGDFNEPDDGVVSVSSSRFPASVPATDLGIFNGDHIAGIRASTFPQEAFLEAVVVTMAELGALDPELSARANSARSRWLAYYSRKHSSAGRAPELADDLRPPAPLPGGSSGWTPTTTFRTFDTTIPGANQVTRITSAAPNGISIQCDQRSMGAFRAEYEFAYDAGNGGSEGSLDNGFSIVADNGTSSGRACRLATRGAAIKMTTGSLHFRPVDFPLLNFRTRVDVNVKGVDPGQLQNGVNDAAFKLWFVLRDVSDKTKDKTFLFGYSWDAPGADGRPHGINSLVEAASSRRSIVIRTLPEAWLTIIGGDDATWITIERNLTQDIERAYPALALKNIEVVAITIQSDSDASRGRSLALLDYISLKAQPE